MGKTKVTDVMCETRYVLLAQTRLMIAPIKMELGKIVNFANC